jgi:peptidoglycan/LPS O-acetylase OafA/YrhL
LPEPKTISHQENVEELSMAGSGAWIRVSGVAVTFGGAFLATYLVRKLLRKKEQRPKAKKVRTERSLCCLSAKLWRFTTATQRGARSASLAQADMVICRLWCV